MKILKYLFLSLFLIFPCLSHAQTDQDRFYQISDFSPLLQSQVSPYLVPEGGAVEATNLRANKKFGSLSKRDVMLLYGSCRNFPVKGLHRYYKSDDTKYLLVASSTFLDLGDDDGGACTSLLTGLTDGKRWDFVTYKDIAIGMNGTDNAIKYDGKTTTTANTDGARTAGDLVTELGAPFAELNTGANLDASSWYQYKVAYYDGTNYYFSTARTNPILTGSSVQDILLTDIPLGESGTTERYIFRTVGNVSRSAVLADSTYARVTTISDNTTRTFADTVVDGSLGGAPTWATVSAGTDVTPPKGRFPEIHKERLFVGNDPSGTISGKSTIYWSDVLNPDYFDTATDFELISPDDGDEIQFIKNQLGKLVIGKDNTIQKFFTDSSSSAKWELSNPFSFIGTASPYAVSNSQIGVIYPDTNLSGIYVFNGQNSRLLSDKVTKDINDILVANREDIAGIFHKNEYQMAYTSEESGASVNDRVLVLDTVRDAYVIDNKDINVFTAFNSGTDFGTLYSGSSGSDGNILAHSSNPSVLVQRLKSEFSAGTTDSVTIYGTETTPTLELGWGVSIDTVTLSGETIDTATYSSATVDRPSTSGTWSSPAINIKASNLNKISWNETLGSVGDVTFAVRLGSSSANAQTAIYSSEVSDPSGSDISGITADDWIQIRGTLSTSDITITPTLDIEDNFVVKLTYSKEGAEAETSVLTLWKHKFTDFGAPGHIKEIKEIQVFYEGTSGTLNLTLENAQGNISRSIDIDLSIDPSDSTTDDYFGTTNNKIYRYIPPVISSDQLIGRLWQLTVTETGVTPWNVNKILFRWRVNDYMTFK